MRPKKLTMPVEPPEDLSAERGLLSCCLAGGYSEALKLGADKDWFADPRHKSIWAAFGWVVSDGGQVDAAAVARQVEYESDYVDDLAKNPPSLSNLAYFANKTHEAFIRRRVFERHFEAITAVHKQQDVEKLLESLQETLWETTRGMTGETNQKDAQRAFLEHLEEAYPKGLPDHSIKTGIYSLDDKLGGLLPGAVYILSGRPGGGKSAFAMFASIAAAKQGKRVAFWSLEMLYTSIAERAAAILSGEDVRHYLKTGQGNVKRIALAAKEFCELPIHIEDSPGLTIDQLKSQARRFREEKKVDLFVIDYLTLLRTTGRFENRVNEVGAMTRAIKVIALECQVPVLLLAQMNRDIEKRESQVPRLSDLRDSGSCEQDADAVMFLTPDSKEGEPDNGLVNLWIRKNRNGIPEAKVALEYTRYSSTFKGVETGPVLVDKLAS